MSADTDSRQYRLISIPQDALLHRWPRLWRSVWEDQLFFGMRDRLDESLRLWLSRGQQKDQLLHDRVALAEAETLLRDFGWALSKSQIDYIQRSLAGQKRHRRVRDYLGLAAIIIFAIFAVIAGAERFNSANQRNQGKQEAQPTQPGKSLASKDTTALEAQLKEAEEKLKQVRANFDQEASQLTALQVQLKQEQDKAQKAQAEAD